MSKFKYAKVIKYPESSDSLYIRYIGCEAIHRSTKSSRYIFKKDDDVAVFIGEFGAEDECIQKGAKPLGINKASGNILGYKIVSNNLSLLKEGQISKKSIGCIFRNFLLFNAFNSRQNI